MTYNEVAGWFTFEPVYDKLASLAVPGGKFIEIGSWFGRSSCYLASVLQKNAFPSTLFCVDTFGGTPTEDPQNEWIQWHDQDRVYLEFLINVRLCGVYQTIVPIRASSHNAASYLRNLSPFRAVFIDGDHHYDAVRSDITEYWPMVEEGGYLSGHDYQGGWDGVDRAVKEFTESNHLPVECLHNCFLIQKPKLETSHS